MAQGLGSEKTSLDPPQHYSLISYTIEFITVLIKVRRGIGTQRWHYLVDS